MNQKGNVWAIVLVLMGLCLVVVAYFVYRLQAKPLSMAVPPVQTYVQSKSVESMVEEDQDKPNSQVSQEVITEIDQLEEIDVATPYGEDQVSF